VDEVLQLERKSASATAAKAVAPTTTGLLAAKLASAVLGAKVSAR